ncbi:MAG: HTH-type transcriptional regulator CysB [Gammaproteobacteria bacterium]|nr:HTH-type transcriptional regulator CysB [Gammaproteobacteria bacterium]
MKLQQLRFLAAIVKNNLNISEAAEKLYTSQPGVSKQIKLLEDELGVELFHRSGKHLTHITQEGLLIIARAEHVLKEVENIKNLAAEFRHASRGTLNIATTHTQARYLLPPVVQKFRGRYPDVDLHFHQGTPRSISEMAVSAEVDFAIATEAIALYSDLIMMPCYRWNRCLVVPAQHPLTQLKTVSIQDLAQHPLVTYVSGLTGRGQVDDAFKNAGLTANVVFTATDADVIKTYVRLGLGVGLIARMAYLPEEDKDLVKIDVSHLFAGSITKIAFRRGMFIRAYMYAFMQLFATHLDRDTVDAVVACHNQEEVDALFENITLPEY